MKKYLLLLLVLSMACNTEKNDIFTTGQWIDLSHDFSKETVYWPNAAGFEKSTVYEGYTDSGFFYTAYKFSSAEHGGTHIDAPIHFFEKGHTVDQIPVTQLIGPAVVIRIAAQAEADRNYLLTVADIEKWEEEHGPIPDGSILLIDTGSDKYWPDRIKYMGTDKRGAEGIKKLSFPGIHPQTARFLIENRKIKAVGLDTPSIDHGPSTLFETHQILFEHNIPGLENVANLDKLPDTGAIVFALPMKIKGGSGAPLRIVAWVSNNQ